MKNAFGRECQSKVPYKHLVQVPRIAEATLPSLQPASVFWTELDAPKSDRFIRDGDPALGKEVLYISKA